MCMNRSIVTWSRPYHHHRHHRVNVSMWWWMSMFVLHRVNLLLQIPHPHRHWVLQIAAFDAD